MQRNAEHMQKICINIHRISRICISPCNGIFCMYMHSPLNWSSANHETVNTPVNGAVAAPGTVTV